MTAPRRHWFAFSLRTLFVMVTVLALWLSENVVAVRERAEVLGHCLSICKENGRGVQKNMPPSWRLLGAEPVWWLRIPYDAPGGELGRMRTLFPEAEMIDCHPDSSSDASQSEGWFFAKGPPEINTTTD